MSWEASGSNGSEIGANSRVAFEDQLDIAIDSLERCDGCFLLVCEDEDAPGGIKFVSAIYGENLTADELCRRGHQFLMAGSQAIGHALDDVSAVL